MNSLALRPTQWRFYTLEQGAQLYPQFLDLHSQVWHVAIIIVTMNNISLLRCVDRNDWGYKISLHSNWWCVN